MFEHFTFGAQAQTQLHPPQDVSTSPTDTTFSSPLSPPSSPPASFDLDPIPSQPGINDIVHRFSQQSLQIQDDEPPRRSFGQAIAPPSPDYDFTPERMSFTRANGDRYVLQSPLQDTPLLPATHEGNLACRRLRRQHNVHLQTCSSHIRDISALVSDMIDSNSQCRLHEPSSRSHPPSPPPSRAGSASAAELDLIGNATGRYPAREIVVDVDEGFAEIEEDVWGLEEGMSLRRASTPYGIRKCYMVRWRASADCVQGVQSGSGRLKVRSKPRMRRRKVTRVPE